MKLTEDTHTSLGGAIGFVISVFQSQSLWVAVITAVVCSVAVRVAGLLFDKIDPRK